MVWHRSQLALPILRPTNSIHDAIILNKLAWHESSVYARPPCPSYCIVFISHLFASRDPFPVGFGSKTCYVLPAYKSLEQTFLF